MIRVALVAAYFVLFIVWVGVAFGASCTDGTDCYCDRVNGGDLNDPNLLFCEDWEAPTLYDDTGF